MVNAFLDEAKKGRGHPDLLGGCYSLSVWGLRLVLIVSHLVMKKMILVPSQVIFARFFIVFVPDSTTAETDPRVVESVTGLLPVEHPH